jgi:hypothetical protein
VVQTYKRKKVAKAGHKKICREPEKQQLTDSPHKRQLEITEVLKPKFDKTCVPGSTLRKKSWNLSGAWNKQKSSGKKNVAEDTSDESEVEGSDRRCIYYKDKYSEVKRYDGWIRSRKLAYLSRFVPSTLRGGLRSVSPPLTFTNRSP